MKYLVFSHFVNRSLQQNNYSLSTVTRWWSFAEELRGTCFLGKTFCVRHQDQLAFAPCWYYRWHGLAWQNNFKLENCVWFGRCFLRVFGTSIWNQWQRPSQKTLRICLISNIALLDHNKTTHFRDNFDAQYIDEKGNWALSSIKPKIGASQRSATFKHVMGKSHYYIIVHEHHLQ